MSSLLQLFYLHEDWPGFIANSICFAVQVYCHYLVMLRYFLNEYFMCSILHYMGYQSVQADKNLVMERWKTYHRYRDIFIYIFQIGMVVFLVGCFAADLVIVLVY